MYIHGVKVNPHSSYKDRVDFNNKTLSLTLKNMQKTDSGLYTARANGETEKNIVIYRVSVIDAVEAPVLTVNSNWSSSDSCNFSCNGSNIIISSIYNSRSCSPEKVTSSDNTLRLNCSDDYIMCNHSNPLSWKIDRKKVNEFCTVDQEITQTDVQSALPSWFILICLLTTSLLASVISWCLYKRKKDHSYTPDQQNEKVGENIKPQMPLDMLEKSKNPSTIYDTVREHGSPDVTMETNQTSPSHDSVNQENIKPQKSLEMLEKSENPHTVYDTTGESGQPDVTMETNQTSPNHDSVKQTCTEMEFLFAMMACNLLLFISLLTYNTGFSAEISKFVQTGNPVQLDIQTQELPEFDELSWRNDKSENIVKYINGTKTVKPHSSYKNRIDFNTETFSLTLKNMQRTDSGLYTARISGESEKIFATYRVSVLDAVEAPVLTLNSNLSSSDPCSFTCKGSNIIISSIYNSSSCSPEEVTSSDNYTLTLNCSDDYIMCKHSNPVSWKNVTKKVNELCTVDQDRAHICSPCNPNVPDVGQIWATLCCCLGGSSLETPALGAALGLNFIHHHIIPG
ncbi:CD48 antigen [Anabarilius grahami]|uniref:CD48 antigen n=1 Tax=Anabarilius grahami TaxID=495550 RepID=A0A3N0YBQ5_ANAGA|nr:CD48 antigen [Anabarilius grahami]